MVMAIMAYLNVNILLGQDDSNNMKLFNGYSKLLSPEKVYLHTDKDVYFATDTIWFSGYVENASYASEFDESNYIYVELISKQLYRDENSLSDYAEYKNDVVVRKKIRRIGSNFQGHLVVPELNSTGRAIIRAYTYWMLNRPTEYMFYKELELTNPMKDKLVAAMAEKQIKRKRDYLRLGELSPEEKAKQEAKDKKDDKERYDVQFLPESGNYVSGSSSVIYVKAIGEGGAGVKVFGDIVNSDGNVVVKYSTDSLGFGRIVIPVSSAEILYASVKDSYDYEGKKVKLPKAINSGVTINGNMKVNGTDGFDQTDKAEFTLAISEELLSNFLKVFLHNGSEPYYSKPLDKATEAISLSLKSLTPGIHSVSVIDEAGNVYAERPFMVLPTGKEYLELNVDKQEYKKRELVNLKIHVPQDILDSTANFSVAVTDMGITDNSERTTMQSYMLMKSELKGYIENIDWYFNTGVSLAERMQRADMLMQTHGWRYYDTEKILQGKTDKPYFGREYKQTLFGKVVKPIGISKKATVSFLAPSINFRAMGQIDSGYFVLRDVSFPENTRFIVSAIGKNGKSQNHTPILQNDYFAPVYEYPVRTEKVEYSDSYRKTVETIYYNNDDGEHAMAFELNPVVVTSQLITPKNSPSPLPNYPIRREWYKDTLDMKSYARNYTVSSYVLATYSGVREYQSGGVGGRIAVPKNEDLLYGALLGPKLSPAYMTPQNQFVPPGRWGLVLVYLNGIYQRAQEAVESVLSLPLSEIESIIYVSGLSASPFQNAFTMGEVSPYPVLMVKTKPHVRTDLVPYNVSSAYPLGWQKPVKFYSPRYDTPETLKKKGTDNRITLYWNPAVKMDENGEATISFYTSDSDSNYRVEVEGRSAARQYHYAEKIIERVKESSPAKKK